MTMRELARLANVSVSTVSKAFGGAEDVSEETRDRIFLIAKQNGCKFYASSDSHSLKGYASVGEKLPAIVEALGLTEDDRYIIP